MVQSEGQSPSRRLWPLEVVGAIVFVGLVIVFGILNRHRPKPAPVSSSKISTVSTTPASFNDCIGTVTAVDATSLTVSFKGTDGSGQAFTKNFHVTVVATTEVKKSSTVNGQRALSPLKLTDMKPGNTVFIAADKNIAPLTAFTATKVYLYSST